MTITPKRPVSPSTIRAGGSGSKTYDSTTSGGVGPAGRASPPQPDAKATNNPSATRANAAPQRRGAAQHQPTTAPGPPGTARHPACRGGGTNGTKRNDPAGRRRLARRNPRTSETPASGQAVRHSRSLPRKPRHRRGDRRDGSRDGRGGPADEHRGGGEAEGTGIRDPKRPGRRTGAAYGAPVRVKERYDVLCRKAHTGHDGPV